MVDLTNIFKNKSYLLIIILLFTTNINIYNYVLHMLMSCFSLYSYAVYY